MRCTFSLACLLCSGCVLIPDAQNAQRVTVGEQIGDYSGASDAFALDITDGRKFDITCKGTATFTVTGTTWNQPLSVSGDLSCDQYDPGDSSGSSDLTAFMDIPATGTLTGVTDADDNLSGDLTLTHGDLSGPTTWTGTLSTDNPPVISGSFETAIPSSALGEIDITGTMSATHDTGQ